MWLGYTVVNKKHGLRSNSNARGILLQRTLLKALCAFSCISKRKEIWPLLAAPTVVALVAVTLIFVSISKANLSFNTKSVELQEGNHHLLVQKIIEVVSLWTLGQNLVKNNGVTYIDCKYVYKQNMSRND